MFPCGPAVELVDPDLLPAQVVWVPCVVLDVKSEISGALLTLLRTTRKKHKTGNTERGKGRYLEIVMAQVLIAMCVCCFFNWVQKPILELLVVAF